MCARVCVCAWCEQSKRASETRGGKPSSSSSSSGLQLLPHDPSVHATLSAAHLRLGKAYAATGAKGDDAAAAAVRALGQFKSAVEHDGASAEARAALADGCRQAAQKLTKTRDLSGAVRCLQVPVQASTSVKISPILVKRRDGLAPYLVSVYHELVSLSTGRDPRRAPERGGACRPRPVT